jgi:hypothetical protein
MPLLVRIFHEVKLTMPWLGIKGVATCTNE